MATAEMEVEGNAKTSIETPAAIAYERIAVVRTEEIEAGKFAPVFICLRGEPGHDDTPTGWLWSWCGFYSGKNVCDGGGCHDEAIAVQDALAGLTAHAAKSRKKIDKATAEYLHGLDVTDLTGSLETFYGAGMFGDEAMPPTAEQPTDTQQAVEQPPAEQPAPAPQADACKCAADQPAADTNADANKTARIEARIEAADAAQADYEQRKADAEQRVLAAMLHRVACDTKLKAAKAVEKECIAELQEITAAGPERLPLFDNRPTPEQPAAPLAPSAAVTTTAPPPAAPADDFFDGPADAKSNSPAAPSDPDAWRAHSIDELGLPPKLAERLREEGCDTVGKLEDLRASVGGLRGVKGIGPAKVTAIEDAVIKWLDRNRDAKVMAEVKAEAKVVAVEAVK